MKTLLTNSIATFIILLFPALVFAANHDIEGFIRTRLLNLGAPIIIVLTALAFIWFIWGIVIFIAKGDSDSEREKGRKRMAWGIIALFVLFSIWGIVRLLQTSIFGTAGTGASLPLFIGP